MASVLIVGDGPAGLSAALFLGKNGQRAIVYGRDQTPMHHAQLPNYLGARDVRGSDFQVTAREQARDVGVELRDEDAVAIAIAGGRFCSAYRS